MEKVFEKLYADSELRVQQLTKEIDESIGSLKTENPSTFGIDIYSNYDVGISGRFSFSSSEYEDGFGENRIAEHFTCNGDKLIEILVAAFNDDEFSSVVFNNNTIELSFFDPMSGNYCDKIINFKQI